MGSGSCIKWIHIMPIKISKTRIDIGGLNLTGLREPLTSTEAATKNYADSHAPRVVTGVGVLIGGLYTEFTANSNLTDVYIVTGASAVLIMLTISGTPVQGQKLTIRVKNTDSATKSIVYATALGVSSAVDAPVDILAGETMYIGLVYNIEAVNWYLTGLTRYYF